MVKLTSAIKIHSGESNVYGLFKEGYIRGKEPECVLQNVYSRGQGRSFWSRKYRNNIAEEIVMMNLIAQEKSEK